MVSTTRHRKLTTLLDVLLVSIRAPVAAQIPYVSFYPHLYRIADGHHPNQRQLDGLQRRQLQNGVHAWSDPAYASIDTGLQDSPTEHLILVLNGVYKP